MAAAVTTEVTAFSKPPFVYLPSAEFCVQFAKNPFGRLLIPQKEMEQESNLVNSSSQMAAESSDTDKSKKKKKKSCNCKGLSSDTASKKSSKKVVKGSTWFKEKKVWEEYIKRHRYDLRHASPVVDDKAPKLNVLSIYDVENLNMIWAGLKGLFDLNTLMVKGLHEVNVLRGKTDTFAFKYSKNNFASNYVTRREEAKRIEKENALIVKMLENPVSRMVSVKEYAEEWKKHEALMEMSSQFPLWWKVEKKEAEVEIPPPPVAYFKQYVTEKSAKYPDKRPRVFLEIAIKNVGVVGRMVAVLYSDYVPMTVKNFLAFCDPKAELSYKGNFFYLIFPNFYCQTGDVVENKGFGGTSIYGPYFGNEDFTLTHAKRGMLTMYSKIPNRNASQFFITFRKLESLDGQNVVFGKIIKGLHFLQTIESVGSKKTGRPKVEIYISDCDEI